ncbi:hypothetical protein N7536_007206 [Penicillium majusculum]|nr:hypothetical protein N7536_007206 [Penicillium majusculum]
MMVGGRWRSARYTHVMTIRGLSSRAPHSIHWLSTWQ